MNKSGLAKKPTLGKREIMKENILNGIVLIIFGCLVLFKAIKYPASGSAMNMNRKEYMVAVTSIISGILCFCGWWK